MKSILLKFSKYTFCLIVLTSCNSSSSKNSNEASNTTVLKQLVHDWNEAHETKDASVFLDLFDSSVLYYGTNQSKDSCVELKLSHFKKYPDFQQQIFGEIQVESVGDKKIKCSFLKRVTANHVAKDYLSYLIFKQTGESWKIVSESDAVTDKNLLASNTDGKHDANGNPQFSNEDLSNYLEEKLLKHYTENKLSEMNIDSIENKIIRVQADNDDETEVLAILSLYPVLGDFEPSPMSFMVAIFDFDREWVLKDSIRMSASNLYDDYTLGDLNQNGQNEIVLQTFESGGGSGWLKKTLILSLDNLHITKLFNEGGFQGHIKLFENNTKIVKTEAIHELEDGGTFSPHKYEATIFEFNGEEFIPKLKKTTKKKYCYYDDCDNRYSFEKVLSELEIKLSL